MNEVIVGERTSEAAVAAIEQLTRDIGYVPVTLKKEVPGFVENRVLYAIMRECLALLDEGVVDAEGLDLCVKWGIGYKLAVVPPIQLLDMAGLDIYTAVASFLNQDLSNEQGISKTATDLRDAGRLGIKSGGGFFDYTPETVKELGAQRAGKLVGVRKVLEG
jgi:3-hydroxybutyryl-CoA dehydrogenase/5-formyl-3-hydroxy-2-methylpyridine 4-carboxylate dehydrogenase